MKKYTKKLSIIIPTKNRYQTIIPLCDYLKSKTGSFEVIITDNSESNINMIDFFNSLPSNFTYTYNSKPLSMRENCSIGIEKAIGEYICMIGDDDGVVIDNVLKCIDIMNDEGYDFALSTDCKYMWPHLQTRLFGIKDYGYLRRIEYKDKLQNVYPLDELDAVYSEGGVTIGKLPRLYQGIVKTKVVHECIEKFGSIFMASMPDMSSSTLLATVIGKGFIYNKPIIINGVSSKSGGGLGAAGKHKGSLESGYGLTNEDLIEWPESVPRFWSGGTVWSASFIITLKKANNFEVKKLNIHALHGYCLVYHYKLFKGFSDNVNHKKVVVSCFYHACKRFRALLLNIKFYLFSKKMKFANIKELVNHIEG
jgi:glycosyltransferase involved in cell wall biosynthesis